MDNYIANSSLKALIYADIFSYPLTLEEIHHRLIADPDQAHTIIQITSTAPDQLKDIIQQQLSSCVSSYEQFYVLKGKPNHLLNRQTNTSSSQPKHLILQRILSYLRLIPTIEFIALTGSLAMNNAQPQDDIDLLIVSSPGTLWITRMQATILLDLLRVRRQPHHTIHQDKICLNLFLDKNTMAVPQSKQDIYSAYEVTQAQPLLNRNDTYSQFLLANHWVIKYLPNAWQSRAKQSQTMVTSPTNKIGEYLNRPLEPIAHKLQKAIMSYSHTTEHVTSTQAFFHPQDHRPRVMNEYHKRLQQFRLA